MQRLKQLPRLCLPLFCACVLAAILSISGVVPLQPAHTATKPGGLWVRTINSSGNFDIAPVTLIARAYPTSPGDPAIAHVNFTASWGGNWHILCNVPNDRPDLGDYYYCSTDFSADGSSPNNENVTVSFDVYDTAGNINYSPNGTFTFYENNTIANATTSALNTAGKILPPVADAFDCVASGLTDGATSQLRLVGGAIKTVQVLAKYLGRANIVYLIAKDVSTSQISHLTDDISSGFVSVPGQSCNDFLQAIGWTSS